MKTTTKRTTLAVAGVLAIGALAATMGTISYFTDVDNATNEFTVGNIDIELFESQLHRMNSGRAGSFDAMVSDPDYCTNTGTNIDNNTGAGPQGTYESAKYCTPGMDAHQTEGISGIENGHTGRTWGYSDQTIKDDAETYQAGADTTDDATDDGYFTRVSKNIVPGQYIRKFAYVENKDESSDAYIMIRYMVPEEYADDLEIGIPGSPYTEGYFTAVEKDGDDFVAYTGNVKQYTGYTETINNTEYRVYAAVTNYAIKPGEMTFWSPVNTIRLKADRQNVDANADKYVASGAVRTVEVDAQAIQAKTFTNGIEAFNAL